MAKETSYFKEELFAGMFDGYKVPEKLKKVAQDVMARFTITGLCDGMYICNLVAYACGTGDGKGHFWRDGVPSPDRAAKELIARYGCNIFPEDEQELVGILSGNGLDVEKACRGLNLYALRCRMELKTCDWLRRPYLIKCISTAKRTYMALKEGGLSYV